MSTPIIAAKKDIVFYFGVQFSQMWGRMPVLGLRSTHYPLIQQNIMQKVIWKENRQPTGVKMVNGIVSADNFSHFQ